MAKSIDLWKIPKENIPEIKQAFEEMNYFWIIKQWNKYEVTFDRICATCPDSITEIKTHIPKLWIKDF